MATKLLTSLVRTGRKDRALNLKRLVVFKADCGGLKPKGVLVLLLSPNLTLPDYHEACISSLKHNESKPLSLLRKRLDGPHDLP